MRISDQLHIELHRSVKVTHCDSLVQPMKRLDVGRADTNGTEPENLIGNSFEMTGIGRAYHQVGRYFRLGKSLGDCLVQT